MGRHIYYTDEKNLTNDSAKRYTGILLKLIFSDMMQTHLYPSSMMSIHLLKVELMEYNLKTF